jgi:hypothetical protein
LYYGGAGKLLEVLTGPSLKDVNIEQGRVSINKNRGGGRGEKGAPTGPIIAG